jgi:hypothetical protein
MAAMEDVTGFNQKSAEFDGEKLINAGILKLRQKYNDHFCEVMRLMLKFNEGDRPSFIELGKILVGKQLGAINA